MKVGDFYQSVKTKLASVDDPSLEARYVTEALTGHDWSDIIINQHTLESIPDIDALIKRRLSGEPLSKILGFKEFYGLNFTVNQHVLDPRPETEILVEKALDFAAQINAKTVLDLGTGSSCIISTLLHSNPSLQGVAADVSEDALEVAQQNAKNLNLESRITFVRSNWFESIGGSFDIIVSNPPYIDSNIVPNLSAEVQNHDPILALDGGDDGLDAYKIIFLQLKKYLNPQGRAFFEIGFDQCGSIERLAEKYRIRIETIYPDLAGIPRVVEISCGDK